MKTETKTIKPFNETGRSMVEMLGVLAIIGVISIGAIAGYTYGMNRYRTNEILDGGTKRAYTVATQLSMGLEPNLSEFKDVNETAGGTFGNTAESVKQWDGEFGISISGVTKPVCENLIRMIGDNTPLRALSKGDGENETELTAGDCADGSNDFYLVYNIGGVGSEPERTTKEDGSCRDGYTGADCSEPITCQNGGQWTADGCECPNGWYGKTCDSDCNGIKLYGDGQCYPCGNDYLPTTSNECARCPGMFYSSGYCFSCNASSKPSIPQSECSKCGLVWNGSVCADENCNGITRADNNACVACPTRGLYVDRVSESECNKCPNTYYAYSVCSHCDCTSCPPKPAGACQ